MAKDFLLVSERYINSFQNDSQKKIILSRRRIILKYLDEQYVMARRACQVVAQELKSMGIGTTVPTIRKDAEAYRLAYRFYHGEKEAVLMRLKRKKDSCIRPIQMLIEDGIDSWEKICLAMELQGSRKEFEVKVSKKEVVPASINLESNFNPDKIIVKLNEPFAQIQAVLQTALDEYKELRAVLKKTRAVLVRRDRTILELKSRCKNWQMREAELLEQLDQQKLIFEKELAASEELCDIADEAMSNLRAQIAQLEERAIAEDDSSEDSDMETDDVSPDMVLPSDSQRFGKPLIYSDSFLKTLEGLEGVEKKIVVKTMNIFSQQGPEYKSLQNRKQFFDSKGLKEGEMKCRAGKYIRFTWQNQAEAVCVNGLFKKKDLI